VWVGDHYRLLTFDPLLDRRGEEKDAAARVRGVLPLALRVCVQDACASQSEGAAVELRQSARRVCFAHAEGGTDRDGTDGNAGVTGHYVSCRSPRAAQCARAYFRQDAQTFYSDRPGDKVSVELSPYDLTKARIVFREQ
jgi:hypothetical protein